MGGSNKKHCKAFLEDQKILWEILDPEKKIGVTLSEEYMMHPEGSVSAIVFHHPESRYFKVNEEDTESFIKGLEQK